MKNFKSMLGALALGTAIAVSGMTGGDVTGTSSANAAEMHGKAANDLRVALNGLLAEHVTLAAAATQAALRGRKSEFESAAGALDQNSQDLAGAIGSVYGKDAGDAFLPLWRKHIGFFVDYTTAKATGSKKKQDKAVQDLLQYAQDFGAFLNSATPALPKDAVADLVKIAYRELEGSGRRAGSAQLQARFREDQDGVASHADDRRSTRRCHSRAVSRQVRGEVSKLGRNGLDRSGLSLEMTPCHAVSFRRRFSLPLT